MADQPTPTPPTPPAPKLPTPPAVPPPAPAAAPAPGEPLVGDGAAMVHLGFWQQPWVQNVLPFATSLVLHVGLIIVGYASFKAVESIVQTMSEEQVIIPDATLATDGQPGGIVNPGTGGENRRAEQNIDESVVESQGFAQNKGEALVASLAGGGQGETEGEQIIGFGGSATNFGKGKGTGAGAGDATGSGSGGDGSGVLAPFGTPGGGTGIGPKSSFAGTGGNARQIVYLCDASGSMNNPNVFSPLKAELKASIDKLVVGQFFNVIFFQDNNVLAYNQTSLVPVNTGTKDKAYEFISDTQARGGTNPIPAIQKAFAVKPQLIYVLTDGFDQVDDFETVYAEFKKLNPDAKVKVNCILLTSDPNRDKKLVDILTRIAKDNGGILKIVSKDQF